MSVANFSFIIAFRNREIDRVVSCLNSLQSFIGFNEVILVDYGSSKEVSQNVEIVSSSYPFLRYYYIDSEGLIWNKCEALNFGVSKSSNSKIVITDIDLIFPENFLSVCNNYDFSKSFLTFDCYYLPRDYHKGKSLNGISYSFVGLMVVEKCVLLELNGFDEYYIGWGVEDDDMNSRLEKYGLTRTHISVDKLTLLHVWHQERSSNLPTPWYLNMVQYYADKIEKKEIVVEKKFIINSSRPAKVIFENAKFENFKKLELSLYREILVFNKFIIHFSQLQSNDIAIFEFEYPKNHKGRLYAVVNHLNNFMNRYKIINYRLLHIRNLLSSKGLNTNDVINFIHLFVGVNRKSIADYYLSLGDKIILIIIKK